MADASVDGHGRRPPQKATRAVALGMAAPPTLAPSAPSAPSAARNTSEAAETELTTRLVGETAATSNGRAAPVEKVAAEVTAA